MITLENYESYYLDYLEGNLNEVDSSELMDFLARHPELKIEGDLDELTFAETADSPTFDASALYQFDDLSITPQNEESWMIAHAENILKPVEKEIFNNYIKGNKHLEKETYLFTQTRLNPTDSVFEDKEKLYKEARLIPFSWMSRVAAAVLIGGLSYYFFTSPITQRSITQQGQIAHQKKPINKVDQPTNHSVQTGTKYSVESNNTSVLVATVIGQETQISEVPSSLSFRTIDLEQKGIEPIPLHQVAYVWHNAQDEDDQEMAQLPTMTKPYEGIASLLSDATGTTIDFQRTEAKNCEKGFKFQVGNFEIGRRTSCK